MCQCKLNNSVFHIFYKQHQLSQNGPIFSQIFSQIMHKKSWGREGVRRTHECKKLDSNRNYRAALGGSKTKVI